MLLFVGVTILVLCMAYFCNTREQVQFHRRIEGSGLRYPADGRRTRQQALNLWLVSAIYLILTALSACRIASGNDYWVYSRMFTYIADGRPVSSEFGFNGFVLLMKYFVPKGHYDYLPIFGVISIVTVFFFIKAIYEQGDWFLGSLFLFLTNGYYFSSFNSIRYYLVLGLAVYSMRYVLRDEYGKFILCILAGATFHKSVLVVIPIYILARWLSKTRIRPWMIVAGLIVLSSFFWAQDAYRWIMFKIYPFYENSDFDHVSFSVTNIGKCAGTIVLCLFAFRKGVKEDKANRFYFTLNLFGLILYTLGSFIPEVTRIAYYTVFPQVFLIPSVLLRIEKTWLRRLCILGTALVFMAYFALFLKTSYNTDIRLLPYLNWIFN